MTPWRVLLLASMLGAAGCTGASAEQMKLGHTVMDASYGYLMAAVDKGYFKEEGLDYQEVVVTGNISTAALLSGDLQVSTASSSAITAILRGAKARVIFVDDDRTTLQLWGSKPEYKTIEDLKGKQVGVTSRGSADEVAVRYLLRQHGLPADYVSFTPLGIGNGRLAMMASGALPANAMQWKEAQELEKIPSFKSARLISDLRKKVRMIIGGAVVTEDTLKNRPDYVLKVTRALTKGAEYCRRFPNETTAMIAHWAQESPAEAKDDYQRYIAAITADGTVDVALQQEEIDLRGAMLGLPKDKLPKPAGVFDFSFVQRANKQLKDKGWQPSP